MSCQRHVAEHFQHAHSDPVRATIATINHKIATDNRVVRVPIRNDAFNKDAVGTGSRFDMQIAGDVSVEMDQIATVSGVNDYG